MPRSPARTVALVVVGLLVLAALWDGAAPARAAPAPGRAPAAAGAQIPIPDPASWFFKQVFVNPFRSSAKRTITNALKAAEVAFQTPDIATQPRIRELWGDLLIVANSLLVLMLVVGAVMVIAGDWTYLEAKELAPRALLAALVVNLSLVLLGEGIHLSNLLVKGFLQVDPNSLSVTADRMMQTGAVAPLLLALLLAAAVLLLLANLIRIVMLVLLGVAGPILHVFGILPQTEGVSRGWWRAAVACLVAPAVQALLLTIGVKVLFSGPGVAGIASPTGAASTLVDVVMVLVVVFLMAIAPLWMFKRAIGVSEAGKHIRTMIAVAGVAG